MKGSRVSGTGVAFVCGRCQAGQRIESGHGDDAQNAQRSFLFGSGTLICRCSADHLVLASPYEQVSNPPGDLLPSPSHHRSHKVSFAFTLQKPTGTFLSSLLPYKLERFASLHDGFDTQAVDMALRHAVGPAGSW